MAPFRLVRRLPVVALSLMAALFLMAAIQSSAQVCTTSITGKVYSPNGPTGGDPIPNILVFVEDPSSPLPTFQQGVSGGCSEQDSLIPKSNMGSATTDATGSFTITDPRLATVNPFTVVIQAGKWRRQYTMTTNPTACTTTTLPAMSMPAAQGPGADLPHIAISTGEADSIECIFNQIGIAKSEFTLPGGTGSINLYEGFEDGGQYSPDSTGTGGANPTPSETVLESSLTNLANYDLVIFGCQGNASEPETAMNGAESNLVSYANEGGRVFATHYGYNWFYETQPFDTAAVWTPNAPTIGSPTQVATIDQTYPEGLILAQWLQNVGGSYNNTLGQVELTNVKSDTSKVINPPAQSWVNLNDTGQSMQFTFDTPIASTSSTVPTVTMTFTNQVPSFLLGDSQDGVVINVSDSGGDADSSLSLALTLPAGASAVSLAGTNANTGWACNINTPTAPVCNRTTALAAGTSDPLQLYVSVSTYAQLGDATISAALSGGGLSGTGQCGRVLFNDYHVESSAPKAAYPSQCTTGPMSAQEKFLEFALYNLTNFIAPVTSDTIDIQSPTTTTLTNPNPSIFYGQTIAENSVEEVTGLMGSTPVGVDGGNLNFYIDSVLVCTLPANAPGTCPPPAGQGYNAGAHTMYSAYAGDTDFHASTSAAQTVTVMPDLTSTSLAPSPSSASFGQAVTLAATVADAYATVTGTVAFFDNNGAPIGTAPVGGGGIATLVTSSLQPGVHSLTACMVASQNYSASCSMIATVIVNLPVAPAPTVTLISSTPDPSVVGQAVTFSATVATTGPFPATPAGSLTFYDGTNALGSVLTLDATGSSQFTTSSLTVGKHTITASYAGTATTAASVSAPLIQIVNTSLISAGTGFLMQVSPTTFTVGAGSSVVLSVLITELNDFQQPVNLTCAGLPAEATCTFGTAQIPATGGSTQLLITPAAPHLCSTNTPLFVAGDGGFAFPWISVSALGLFLVRKRRRLFQGMALAALLGLLPALSGCGSGNCTDFGVKPGTYTFTVTGTSVPSASPVVTTPTASPVTQTQSMTMNVTIQ